MQWLYGSKPVICPVTGLTAEMRRKYVAILRASLRRPTLDQQGIDAIRALVPELGPNGTEPEFDI